MKGSVLVYISGPMTANDGRTMEQNTADGVAVYLDLLKRGVPAFSPHLSGAFPSAWTALTHQEWIAYDYAIIDRCTHMLMMPRWKKSKGASLEFEYAMNRRMPIAFSIEQLLEQVNHSGGSMDQDERNETSSEQPTTGATETTGSAERQQTTAQGDGDQGSQEPKVDEDEKTGVPV